MENLHMRWTLPQVLLSLCTARKPIPFHPHQKTRNLFYEKMKQEGFIFAIPGTVKEGD